MGYTGPWKLAQALEQGSPAYACMHTCGRAGGGARGKGSESGDRREGERTDREGGTRQAQDRTGQERGDAAACSLLRSLLVFRCVALRTVRGCDDEGALGRGGRDLLRGAQVRAAVRVRQQQEPRRGREGTTSGGLPGGLPASGGGGGV